jgi:hypothetical protein
LWVASSIPPGSLSLVKYPVYKITNNNKEMVKNKNDETGYCVKKRKIKTTKKQKVIEHFGKIQFILK